MLNKSQQTPDGSGKNKMSCETAAVTVGRRSPVSIAAPAAGSFRAAVPAGQSPFRSLAPLLAGKGSTSRWTAVTGRHDEATRVPGIAWLRRTADLRGCTVLAGLPLMGLKIWWGERRRTGGPGGQVVHWFRMVTGRRTRARCLWACHGVAACLVPSCDTLPF